MADYGPLKLTRLGAVVGQENTTTDTTTLAQRDLDGGAEKVARVTVIAVEANYARYLRDATVTSASVQGAYGVVGAISTAEVAVPPRSTRGGHSPAFLRARLFIEKVLASRG